MTFNKKSLKGSVFLKFLILLLMCTCVYLSVCLYTWVLVLEEPERGVRSPGSAITGVSHPMWVRGKELQSSERAECSLYH